MEPKYPVGSKVVVRKEFKGKVKEFFYNHDRVNDILTIKNWFKPNSTGLQGTYYFKDCSSYLFEYEIDLVKGQMSLPFKFK